MMFISGIDCRFAIANLSHLELWNHNYLIIIPERDDQ